jgi:hypothetical protein
MSERWKYQIKSGGLWGVFMSVFMVLFDIKEHPFIEQIVRPEFWVRAVVYIVLGIFGLGYINWRSKVKQDQSNKN